ncbi:MAG: hypothetical protein IE909_09815 [Campylobacterales bacterium]|nr:hypothetical protein [Campylobacterales bacterium]
MIDINKFQKDKCPFCGRDDFYSIREEGNDVIYDYYSCLCGGEWSIKYSITKIEVKGKDGLNEITLVKC